MTNSQRLVRQRQQKKLHETDRMDGVEMRDWKGGGGWVGAMVGKQEKNK